MLHRRVPAFQQVGLVFRQRRPEVPLAPVDLGQEEAVAGFHALIAALAAAGIPADRTAVAVDTVMAYVTGYTVEEQGGKAETWPREQRDAAFRA
ncbi:TetR/AcrR family transcriptional regulator C-terminal domain-containing protein [Nonomuraea sp. NPDC052116]|uniref:TetR/AcrR family transcriptional regulator C-terminal domain-containing protein n=1 Tax=Nonomuraea sp. NPDC052116 TaxID=3155665 RepID=UPI0034163775